MADQTMVEEEVTGQQSAARARRSFGPVVLLGLAGAGLAAVAASRDWARASGSAAGAHVAATVTGSSSAPLAVALALVALAAWGVVLVLRRQARRAVAVLGALASGGALAAIVAAFGHVRDDAIHAAVARGGTGNAFDTSLTGWYVACAVGAGLALLAFVAAVVVAPAWPAMGSRYDAPAARQSAAGAHGETGPTPEPATEPEMWRALDEGRDPTT